MAIESHLAELEKRHQALEQEINEALSHPSTDDLKIAELKRRKLHVKDEIARLSKTRSSIRSQLTEQVSVDRHCRARPGDACRLAAASHVATVSNVTGSHGCAV